MKQHCFFIINRLLFLTKKIDYNKLFYDNFLSFKSIKLSFVLIILLATTNFGYSQISFAPYQTYPTGSYIPEVVCIGDINNDNLNDVVVGSGTTQYGGYTEHILRVFLQDNTGHLMLPVLYSFPPINLGRTINSIAISDMNNDGLNDVIIGYDTCVGIFYQNTSGTLNSIIRYSIGTHNYIEGLSIGDLNHDGFKDIAICGFDNVYNNEFVGVLYQDTSNNFYRIYYPAIQGQHQNIKVADINDDQLDDMLIFTGSWTIGLQVYIQNNNGSLDNPIFYSLPLFDGAIDIGDLNNDSINDIAITAHYQTCLLFQDTVSHLLQSPIYIPVYQINSSIKIADLNCDGRNEIIVAPSGAGDSLSIYEQDTNNLYNSYSLYKVKETSCHKYCLDVGDINNDGKKDIVTSSLYYNGICVLINQSPSLGNCCILPIKPPIPKGDTVICQNGTISTYKPLIPYTGNIFWNLRPAQAGNIISSNNDSCVISWNNSWCGIADIYLKTTNSCGSVFSDTLYVNVNRVLPINLGNDTIICASNSMVLNAGNGCYTSYIWQNHSAYPIFTVTYGGTYYVESSNICGTASDTIIVQNVPLPTVNLGNDTMFCSGTSFQYDVTLPENNNYLWQDNSTNPVLTVTSPGIYSVTITDSNNCHNQKSVSVGEISPPTVHLPDDTTYCDTINIALNVFSSGCSYHWQDGSTDSVYAITQAGQYIVTVTNVCGNSTDSLKVNEIPLPAITLPDDTSFCTGETFILNVTQHGNFPYHYLWQDGSTSSVLSITSSGYYSVIISDSVLCQSNKTIKVDEFSAPVVNFPDETSICSGNQFILDAFNPNSNYLWQDSSTLSQYFVQDSGVYTVIVNNICGSAKDSAKVIVNDCTCYLDVPSAFSPNGDENNDVLYAVGRNVENINFIIFDRWGKKVFESKSLSNGWDGTFKGKKLDANVFMYHISATSIIDGHSLHKEGNISLIR